MSQRGQLFAFFQNFSRLFLATLCNEQQSTLGPGFAGVFFFFVVVVVVVVVCLFVYLFSLFVFCVVFCCCLFFIHLRGVWKSDEKHS